MSAATRIKAEEGTVNRYYHFTGDRLRNGDPVPPIGEWLEVDGEPVLCERGLHASEHPFDALQYAPGNNLHLVELGGKIVRGDDKVAATRRRIVATIDAEPLLREFARWCAVQVVDLWDCPAVVREYLETGDESKRAAARDAARDAAWDAQRTKFNAMVDAAFKEATC